MCQSVHIENRNLSQLETVSISNLGVETRRKFNRERLKNYNRMLEEKKNYLYEDTAETVKQTTGTHTMDCIQSFATRSLTDIKRVVCKGAAQSVRGTTTGGGNINITTAQWEEIIKGAHETRTKRQKT